MARYRLRIGLQEVELIGASILIGRSPECHITLDDALVSRKHARIAFGDGGPDIEDLASRNGTRVNGRFILGRSTIRDGDRLRFGAQELVFLVIQGVEKPQRPTGFLRVCHSCGVPYPENAHACPHCGAEKMPVAVDTTITGVLEPKKDWSMQLISELIDRATALGRHDEADRVMRRFATELETSIARGELVTQSSVDALSDIALRLSRVRQDDLWIRWILNMCGMLQLPPSQSIVLARESFSDALRMEVERALSRL